jgi:hypothetical protein
MFGLTQDMSIVRIPQELLRRLMRYSTLVFACALSIISHAIPRTASATSHPAQAPAAPSPAKPANSLNVPADTTFFAKLTTPFIIAQAKNDDPVEAQTTQDIKQGHDVLLKKGSTLLGHVRSVQPPTADKPETYVVIVFDQVKPKGGDEAQFSLIIQALAPELDANRDIADATGTKVEGATRNAGVNGHAVSAPNQLTGSSKGVYGIVGLQLGDRLTDGKHYTVLAASGKDIQLKKGMQLVMKVVNQ